MSLLCTTGRLGCAHHFPYKVKISGQGSTSIIILGARRRGGGGSTGGSPALHHSARGAQRICCTGTDRTHTVYCRYYGWMEFPGGVYLCVYEASPALLQGFPPYQCVRGGEGEGGVSAHHTLYSQHTQPDTSTSHLYTGLREEPVGRNSRRLPLSKGLCKCCLCSETVLFAVSWKEMSFF